MTTKREAELPPAAIAGLPSWLTAGRLTIAAAGLGAAVLAVALLAGGGAPAPPIPGLPSSGAGTGWALPISRLLTDGAAILSIGLLLTASLLLPSKDGRLAGVAVRLTGRCAYVAAAWVVAICLQIVLTLSDEVGEPAGSALDVAQLRSFLTEIVQGRSCSRSWSPPSSWRRPAGSCSRRPGRRWRCSSRSPASSSRR